MRLLCVGVLILLIGCHTCPQLPAPSHTPREVYELQTKDRPEDLTGRIIMDERIPEWLRKNYVEWVRYGLDQEKPYPR